MWPLINAPPRRLEAWGYTNQACLRRLLDIKSAQADFVCVAAPYPSGTLREQGVGLLTY